MLQIVFVPVPVIKPPLQVQVLVNVFFVKSWLQLKFVPSQVAYCGQFLLQVMLVPVPVIKPSQVHFPRFFVKLVLHVNVVPPSQVAYCGQALQLMDVGATPLILWPVTVP